MKSTRRCWNQNKSLIQVDQPASGEKVESMLRGGCARGGNKTKEDVKAATPKWGDSTRNQLCLHNTRGLEKFRIRPTVVVLDLNVLSTSPNALLIPYNLPFPSYHRALQPYHQH